MLALLGLVAMVFIGAMYTSLDAAGVVEERSDALMPVKSQTEFARYAGHSAADWAYMSDTPGGGHSAVPSWWTTSTPSGPHRDARFEVQPHESTVNRLVSEPESARD